MTKQQRKKQAIKYLKQLDVYEPLIKGFEENDHVCLFEHYGGYWVYQRPLIEEKMKLLEKKFHCTVYAITHEITNFGECYSFLVVTNYKHEWPTLLESNKDKHSAFAYVWNKTDEWCSEFGSVLLHSDCGGLNRIG